MAIVERTVVDVLTAGGNSKISSRERNEEKKCTYDSETGGEYSDETKRKREKDRTNLPDELRRSKLTKRTPKNGQDSDRENEMVSMMKKIMSRNDELLKEMKLMREEQKKYSDQIKSLKEENKIMSKEISRLNEKVEYLEKGRKKNLIVTGLDINEKYRSALKRNGRFYREMYAN
ncbi:hypothetical protein ILUMI_10955 [Ignelater luminosus]|uniref:Uncharacterized protein n=1 Tax=Ignelater luminosus TaxID=2038154 RepID=A0A8K0GD51_IGNLU|nr:hypothetical protein ILUMI_10955 [Ignelater luminosus]